MAWSTNSSDNLTTTTCIPCQNAFSHEYAAMLVSLSLLGLSVNGWALWLRVSSPVTEKTDLLTCSLNASNFLIILTVLLLMSGIVFFSHSSQYMWSFLLSLLSFGTPLFHCLICVERYLAVRHPTVFLQYRPLRYRARVLATAWSSLLITYAALIAVCATQEDHVVGFPLFQTTIYILMFVINSFCCACILRILIRPFPGDGGKDGGRQNGSGCPSNQRKKKALLLVALIQLFMIICYLPPIVLTFRRRVLVDGHFCDLYMYNVLFIVFSSSYICGKYLMKMGKLKWMKCPGKK